MYSYSLLIKQDRLFDQQHKALLIALYDALPNTVTGFCRELIGRNNVFLFFFFTYYLISIHVFPILNPPSKKTYLKIHMVHRVKALKN